MFYDESISETKTFVELKFVNNVRDQKVVIIQYIHATHDLDVLKEKLCTESEQKDENIILIEGPVSLITMVNVAHNAAKPFS